MNKNNRKNLIILGSVLIFAWLLRLYAAYDYWAWLDEYIPHIWQERNELLSQDASTYAQQAKTAIEEGYPTWGSDAFYRPPLSSFYFQYLFGITNFDRFSVSAIQATVAIFAYLFLFLTAKKFFPSWVAYISIITISVHPVLIFYDIAIEDSVPALFFLSLGIWIITLNRTLYQNHLLLGAGIIFALAALSRPNIFLMLPALGIWIGARQKQSTDAYYEATNVSLTSAIYYFFLPIIISLFLNLIYSTITEQTLNIKITTFGSGWSFGYIEYFIFGIVLSIAAYIFIHSRQYEIYSLLFSGALIGLAGLLYSAFLLISLPVFLIAIINLNKAESSTSMVQLRTSSIASLTILLLPVVVMISVTSIHNSKETDHLSIIVPTSGENLNWGNSNNPDYLFSLQGNEPAPWLRESAPYRLYNVVIWEEYPNSSGSMYDAKREAALAYIASHPKNFLSGLSLKARKTLSNYEIPRNRNFSLLKKYLPVFRIWYVPFSIFFFLAILSLTKKSNKNETMGIYLFAIPPLAIMLTEIIFFNASRYRTLGLPFLIPIAVFGAYQLIQYLKYRKIVFVLVLLGGIIIWVVSESSVSQEDKNKYLSASFYKKARSLIISDGKNSNQGFIRLRDKELFRSTIDDSLGLFPDNISAFNLKIMDQIYNLNSPNLALNEIEIYSTSCKELDFVCARSMIVLNRIANNPETHTQSAVPTSE